MQSRGARTARGIVAALIATFAATFSHAIADGCPPGILGLIIALALAIPVCVLLAGKRLSAWRLAIAVLLSQLGFHATMTLGTGSASFTTAGGHLGHGGMLMVTDIAGGASHADHGVGMWTAHLIAALVTILALRRGEAAFWATLKRTRLSIAIHLLTFLPPASLEVPAYCAPRVDHGADRLAQLSLLRHRGPPRSSALALI